MNALLLRFGILTTAISYRMRELRVTWFCRIGLHSKRTFFTYNELWLPGWWRRDRHCVLCSRRVSRLRVHESEVPAHIRGW